MSDMDLVESALQGSGALVDPALRELVVVARRVGDALGAADLSPELRRRIRARAFQDARRRRMPLPAGVRPQAVIGGAAVTLAAAALGLVVLRIRRHAAAIA